MLQAKGLLMKRSASAESDAGHEVLRHIQQFLGLHVRDFLAVFGQTVSEWSDDKAPRLGASHAFYTLLSLAPPLVIIVAVAALV
jgi:uncharacterized BrkB/YihY/UPF0761 family membrane protein